MATVENATLDTDRAASRPPARPTPDEIETFRRRYEAGLRSYLDDPGERERSRAYELGRRALEGGFGVLELAAAHADALRALLRAGSPAVDPLVSAAGDFFAECLSPFEMSHRGAREGAHAWQRLNEALENEAKRIAHALHDEAAQLLASVHMSLAEMRADLPPQGRVRVEQVKWLLLSIESHLRTVSHELRPTVLDRLGLRPALQFLAESVAQRAGIAIAVEGDDPGRLPPVLEITLYRIAQEALANVVRHARASGARIELQAEAQRVSCTVRDDGVGFSVEAVEGASGLGLLVIRERLNALGGTLCLSSTPGGGTMLRAEIPRGG